jgi:hypothetical protein
MNKKSIKSINEVIKEKKYLKREKDRLERERAQQERETIRQEKDNKRREKGRIRKERELESLKNEWEEDWIWKVQNTIYDCDEAKNLREHSDQEFIKCHDEERDFFVLNAIAKTFTPENCIEKLKNMSIDEQYNLLQLLDYQGEYYFIYKNVSEKIKNRLMQYEETTRVEFNNIWSKYGIFE